MITQSQEAEEKQPEGEGSDCQVLLKHATPENLQDFFGEKGILLLLQEHIIERREGEFT